MQLSRVDKRIISVLVEKKPKSRSTYQIAKKAGISWSTAIAHCYKLKADGIIDGETEKPKFGSRDTIVWRKKKE
ncbi:MAG: hypothetical protein V3T58_02200 [Candidatus Hydrothermarchaeales archaeon]